MRAVGDGALAPGRRPRYDPAACRVTANTAGLAFEGIEPPVWEYRIGGYRVLERWLAARAGHVLTLREIEDFRRAAAALGFTLEVQFQVERVWPEVEEGGKVEVFPAGKAP